MNPFSYKMLSASELELNITGVIGDGWDDNAVTAKAVRKALSEGKNAKRIVVNVDSSGGSFFDGLAIYQMLQEHPATVEAVIGARAASAASIVAMSGDTITMHETSTMLVHPIWTIAIGNAAELRKAAEDLDMLSESAVKAYAARTGMSAEAVRSLMAENRFMSAEEAQKFGFCTDVRKAKRKEEKAMSEQQIHAEIDAMRTRATASAAALRVAAMAPETTEPGPAAPESSIAQPPAVPVETGKTHTMAQLAVILAALGLTEGTADADVLSAITNLKASASASDKLISALGAKTADEAIGVVAALQANREQTDPEGHAKVMAALGAANVDEAVGKIAALQGDHDALALAQVQLATFSKNQEQNERESVLAKLREDGKCSPAQEEQVFPHLSLAALKAFAATATPFLKGDGRKQPSAGDGYNGKKYAQLTFSERQELKENNLELFNVLRDEAVRAGDVEA
jgi:ATP-dependent Clp protease protease subunit